jgi:hypothetical protein
MNLAKKAIIWCIQKHKNISNLIKFSQLYEIDRKLFKFFYILAFISKP